MDFQEIDIQHNKWPFRYPLTLLFVVLQGTEIGAQKGNLLPTTHVSKKIGVQIKHTSCWGDRSSNQGKEVAGLKFQYSAIF